MTRRIRGAVGAVLVALALLTGVAPAASAQEAPAAAAARPAPLLPIVFVHGALGSASQFQTQALRFASNGYPVDHVVGLDYDSLSATGNLAAVWDDLDATIDAVLADTGAERVELVGHSLGTFVSQAYLTSTPERAARVAHYVNLDGRPAAAPPAGVPTLAVWGEGSPDRTIVGAENVQFADQSHTQVATSASTFAEMYELFRGRRPRTTDVLPQVPTHVSLAGEALLFPANEPAEGSTVEVWRVDPRTGRRAGRRPAASYPVGPEGTWGPFRADGRATYEMAIVSAPAEDGTRTTHHFYAQPYRRSDHLIRLLTSRPGEGVAALLDRSERHTNLTITRNQEWWGDQGAAGDVLTVGDQSVLNAATAPRSKRALAFFAFDDGADGVSHLDAVPEGFGSLPFLTGADVFVPAATPPDATIRIATVGRAGDGETEVVNVPNWASSTDAVSVQLRDYHQHVDAFRRPRGR